ncbi:MAG: cell division protein ZapB [Deltaproteobacteria bacterium]|nr:cell division protein ZapB [Deltaproteobacteria bacterium]
MAFEILEQLEARIQASVKKIEELRRLNEELQKKLAESEHKYQEAAARFDLERKSHEDERQQVRARIEKILARFNGLEL